MCGKMFVWLLATVLLATGSPVEAQQPTRTARIGLLGGMSRSTLLTDWMCFATSCASWVIRREKPRFEERWADRKLDRLDDLVGELIERKIEAEEFRRSCSPAKLQRLYFHEF
jgi:hypothetical protein